jgi:hypothetical protein
MELTAQLKATYLINAGRNLAITLDEVHKPSEARLVTELVEMIETLAKVVDPETVIIEREVFKQLFETSVLFTFWLDNVGRMSLRQEMFGDKPVFNFVLNPPGKRQQFLRADIIQALTDAREALKSPQYR